MNISFLNASIPFPERAKSAGIVTLQGMLTIFAVLAILWFVIEIMHYVIHGGTEKKEQNSSPSVPSATPDDAAVAAAIAAALAASEDDGATVAAITAAIIAARAEEGIDTPFRVVSFKKRGNARNGRTL